MMSDFRWTIEELLARYDLEPDLRDVFVEGTFDREVLSQHRSGGCVGRTYYEVDAVDLPASVLVSHGLTLGNKQRVIALSKELAQVSPLARVLCFVDRDLDHWFVGVHDTARLRWSIFCSIESHFLTKDIVRDILVIMGRSKIQDFDRLFEAFELTLRRLYSLRLADRELGLNLKWVAVRKYLTKSEGSIEFDLERYTHAVLNSSAALARKGEFSASAKRWMSIIECDVRLACRGHDYTDLLAWVISEFGGLKEFASAAAIERIFVLLGRSVSSIGRELQ